MDKRFNPVVMAGGVGSRLWPLSRDSCLKQYQQLVDTKNDYTMLQQTLTRSSGLALGKNPAHLQPRSSFFGCRAD